MARTKKVSKFDFSGMPHLYCPQDSIDLPREELVKEVDTVLNDMRANNEYVSNYMVGYLDQLKVDELSKNAYLVTWAKRTLWGAKNSRFQKEYNERFMKWYPTHEGAQELYKACVSSRWWWSDGDGKNITVDDAKAQGRFDAPRDVWDFISVYDSREGREYVETNREQVFEVGDVVVLRKPYVGSYDYDPHYRNEDMTRDDKRYGTIMEEGTGEFATRYHGKGSRSISVLWFGKSSVVTVPEKILKFESRKGRG
jgi:hypothetical protein